MQVDLSEEEIIRLVNLVTADMVEKQRRDLDLTTPLEVEISRKLRAALGGPRTGLGVVVPVHP
jgi:hypothetical protein